MLNKIYAWCLFCYTRLYFSEYFTIFLACSRIVLALFVVCCPDMQSAACADNKSFIFVTEAEVDAGMLNVLPLDTLDAERAVREHRTWPYVQGLAPWNIVGSTELDWRYDVTNYPRIYFFSEYWAREEALVIERYKLVGGAPMDSIVARYQLVKFMRANLGLIINTLREEAIKNGTAPVSVPAGLLRSTEETLQPQPNLYQLFISSTNSVISDSYNLVEKNCSVSNGKINTTLFVMEDIEVNSLGLSANYHGALVDIFRWIKEKHMHYFPVKKK